MYSYFTTSGLSQNQMVTVCEGGVGGGDNSYQSLAVPYRLNLNNKLTHWLNIAPSSLNDVTLPINQRSFTFSLKGTWIGYLVNEHLPGKNADFLSVTIEAVGHRRLYNRTDEGPTSVGYETTIDDYTFTPNKGNMICNIVANEMGDKIGIYLERINQDPINTSSINGTVVINTQVVSQMPNIKSN